MPTHQDYRWSEMDTAFEHAQEIQKLADAYNIPDVMVDNGLKVLQVAIAVGLDVVPGRQGADYIDRMGNVFEGKTMDLSKKTRGFSTCHHLHGGTITEYRKRTFIFSTYDGMYLQESYAVTPDDMEPLYLKWAVQLRTKTHLNNPKIPLEFIREVGDLRYMKDVAPVWMLNKMQGAA